MKFSIVSLLFCATLLLGCAASPASRAQLVLEIYPWPIGISTTDCQGQYTHDVAAPGGVSFFLNCWGDSMPTLEELQAIEQAKGRELEALPDERVLPAKYNCGRPLAYTEWCL